jgi:hypothetical protein
LTIEPVVVSIYKHLLLNSKIYFPHYYYYFPPFTFFSETSSPGPSPGVSLHYFLLELEPGSSSSPGSTPAPPPAALAQEKDPNFPVDSIVDTRQDEHGLKYQYIV